MRSLLPIPVTLTREPIMLTPTPHTSGAVTTARRVRHLILSDLHLSAGCTYQDATTEAQVAAFVRQQAADPQPLELVFAGDTFEFLQVLPAAVDSRVWSEATATARISAIIHAHANFVEAMGQFLKHPDHRATFLIGNHDFELHYGAVQRALRAACAADATQLRIATSYRAPELAVVHGNQYEPWDGFVHFGGITEPFEEVRGTQLVRRLLNPLKALPLDLAALLDHTCPHRLYLRYLLLPAQVRQPQVRRLLWRAVVLAWQVSRAPVPRYQLAAPPAAVDLLTTLPAHRPCDWRLPFALLVQRELARLARHPALADVRVFVAGHTHAAGVFDLGQGRTYLNTGTWKPLLVCLQPPRTMPQQHTFGVVEYAPDGLPQARLLVWQGEQRPAAVWQPDRAPDV